MSSSKQFQASNTADCHLSIFAQEQLDGVDDGVAIGFDDWHEALDEFLRIHNNGGTRSVSPQGASVVLDIRV